MKKSPRSNQSQLKLEREILVRRSMLLREQIAHESMRLKPTVRVADTALDAVSWAKANPGLVLGIAGSLFVLRPKRMVNLGLRALGLWRVGSRFLPILRVVRDMRR